MKNKEGIKRRASREEKRTKGSAQRPTNKPTGAPGINLPQRSLFQAGRRQTLGGCSLGPLKRPAVSLSVLNRPLSYVRRVHIRVWVMIVLHSPFPFLFCTLSWCSSPIPLRSFLLHLPIFLRFPLPSSLTPSSFPFLFSLSSIFPSLPFPLSLTPFHLYTVDRCSCCSYCYCCLHFVLKKKWMSTLAILIYESCMH